MAPVDSGDSVLAAEPYLRLRTLARPRPRARGPTTPATCLATSGGSGGRWTSRHRAASSSRSSPPDRLGRLAVGWGTFAANLTGTLLLGYLLTRFLVAAPRTTLTIPLLCVGLLGSYATFSAFVVEVARLVHAGRTAMGVAYGLISIAVGFPAAQLVIRLAEQSQ